MDVFPLKKRSKAKAQVEGQLEDHNAKYALEV